MPRIWPTSSPPSIRRRRWTSPFAIATGLCLVAAVLFVLGAFPQGFVRRLIERRLREGVGPESRLGAVRIVPGRLQAELTGALLVGPGYRIEVPRARIGLSAAALIHGTYVVRRLELEAPRVELSPRPQAAPADTVAQDAIPPLSIDDLRVVGGSIVFVDPDGGGVSLHGLSARGSIGHGALEVSAPGGEWRRAQRVVTVGPLDARARVSPRLEVRLDSLSAGTASSRVRLAGDVGRVTAPALDLYFDADLDTAEANLIDGLPPSTGRVQATGSVAGRLSHVRAQGRATATGLVVGGFRIDGLEADLEHEGPAGPSRAKVALKAAGGRMQGDFRLTGSEVVAEVDLAQVRLEALPAGAGLRGSVSGRFEGQGDLRNRVRVTGKVGVVATDALEGADRLDASASGWVSARDKSSDLAWKATFDRKVGSPTGDGFGSLSGSASGNAKGAFPPRVEGTLSGHAVARSATGAMDVPFEGSFDLAGDRVRADLQAQGEPGPVRLSLRSTGTRIERFEARADGLDLRPLLGDGSGSLDLRADLKGAMDRLSGSVSARAQELVYAGETLGDVSLDLALREGAGRLEVAAPSMRARSEADVQLARGGSIRGNVHLDQTPLAPAFALARRPDARPSDHEVIAIDEERPNSLRAFRKLEGQVSAQVQFDVPLQEPARSRVEARVSALSATSGPWSARAGAFTVRVEEDAFALDRLSLDLNGTRIEASGRAARDTRSSDLSVRLDGDLAGLPVASPWKLGGRLSGDVRVTGPWRQLGVAGSVALDNVDLGRGGISLLTVPRGRLDLREDRIVWDGLSIQVADGTLTSAGELPLAALLTNQAAGAGGLAPEETARIEARLQGVRAETLYRALRPGGRDVVSATLAGELHATVGRGSAMEITGDAVLEAMKGRAGGVDFETGPVTLRLDRGVLTLAPVTIQSAGEALEASGRWDASADGLAASARGRLDLRALTPVTAGVSLAGTAIVDVRVEGGLRTPRAAGALVLEDGAARSREFPQPLTDLNGRITLEPGLWRVESLTGRLGGGTLEIAGSARPDAGKLSDVLMTAAVQDVALHYPGDFKSRIGADLKLTGRSDALRLEGEVRVQRGFYDTDIFLDEALTSPSALHAFVEPSPFLRTIALDVGVATENRILVRNNLAELSATGRVQVRGDLANPAPFGRFEIAEGGTVLLQTREFTIRSGHLNYEGSLDPTVSIQAESVIRQPDAEDVAVTVSVQGPLLKPQLSLSSDPSYSEREIASLIATGRRNVALDSSAWVAGEQTAALLAGRLTRNVSRGLEDLGLDEVSIQPDLLARETDPGARFTFGKQLTPRVKLVYSLGLNDPESTFYQAEYDFRLRVPATARVQRDDEGITSYGFGQRLRWGAPGPARPARARREARAPLEDVQLTVDGSLREDELRRVLKTKPGKKISAWGIQEDAERLERRLMEAGHIEAIVSAYREEGVARFDVHAGPRYRWQVIGMAEPPDLSKTMQEARFEEEALEQGRRRLLSEAWSRGHPEATVEAVAKTEDDERTLLFHVDLGPNVTVTDVRFPGADGLSEGRLSEVAGGPAGILASPATAREAVLKEYRREHFLAAEVDEPVVTESADRSRVGIEVPVREGPRARVARIGFTGASPPDAVLLPLAQIEPGAPYDLDAVHGAIQRMRDWYLEGGFAATRFTPRLEPVGTDYEIVFDVNEGDSATIGEVKISGLRRTRESLVRSCVEFRAGEPLDPRRLVKLERRLLDLGVFSRVAVTASNEAPSTIQIDVEERGPYSLAYDVRFSGAERATGSLDAELGNVAGLGIALGARHRQGTGLRESRASIVAPAIGRARGLTLALFRSDERFDFLRGRRALRDPLADRVLQEGLEVRQSLELRDAWKVVYGYQFKVLTREPNGFTRNVAGVEISLIRDTRDDPLDAHRGRFWSLSLDVLQKQLGSDFSLVRLFGQAFVTRPLRKPWFWAQGYRLGVSTGLDERQRVETQLFGRATELFRAGGASSLRGFATDSIGPQGSIPGISAGGDAVVILNQELRYQHATGLGAAIFYDAGNVFSRLGDFGFQLRHSAGAGLRYSSPIGLLRIDVGLPIGRKPGESAFQWFFSIGQAF